MALRFKLDENLGSRVRRIFEEAGYEVDTVREEGLAGYPDGYLYKVCCDEQRCLVSLDLDFSDVLRFPPNQANGLVILRLPQKTTYSLLLELVRQFLKTLEREDVKNRLWIVEPGRIRIHQPEGE